MRLYNTLTRQIDDFKPLQNGKATVYTCGPTVYDYPHIGNWFTFIRYDVLVRTLQASGYDVQWVMNITDVGHLTSDADEGEDKLEKGAHREGKTAWDVARFYGDYFVDGLKRLNILTPSELPKATDHIEEQIALVKKLEDRGFTYIIDDGVYFETAKFPKYADFARLDADEQQAGKRVDYNPQKHSATDFALWKLSPVGSSRDMEWESPWGKGFPGWHIECSAMSMKYLGDTLDIHSGGIDHIPVHHTNEIAQSEAATDKTYANYWLHTNHISVEGEKISKSLGNGITLEDIEKQGFSMDDFRLHVLESHYRSQSKFSWTSLQAAHNRLLDLKALAALRWQTKPSLADSKSFSYTDVVGELLALMQNDLHSEAALTYLSDVTKQALTVLVADREREHFDTMLKGIDDLLGTRLCAVGDITAEQKQLLADRESARMRSDWPAADIAREQLTAAHIGLRDTPHGAVWYYQS